jgi:general stress protein YciG
MDVKEFARLGGLARAAKLTKEKLSDIGRKAGKASGKARKNGKRLTPANPAKR